MRRIAGVIALVAGAMLAVVGSLGPLYVETVEDSVFRSGYRMTVWGSEYATPEGGVEFSPSPILYGVPMAAAAALLVLAAVLVLVSAWLPARVALAVRVGTVAATALLIGSVWTVGQVVLAAGRQGNSYGRSVEVDVGVGIWLLVAACVMALAGSLLVQHRRAPDIYHIPGDDETDTPPMGLPIHPPVSTEESSPG